MRKVILFIAMSLDGYIEKRIPLKLVKTQSYDGITDLVYERRE